MPEQPSRQTLDDVPRRVLTFLMAVGESLPIRGALASKGYTEAEHNFAWSLLQNLAVFSAGSGPTLDGAVRDAVTKLDAWDEPNFACIRATLNRLHPEQAEFLFDHLEPKQGPESVIAVATLLDRLDALENGAERKATRKADHAVLATLAGRGYTKEERARLRELVNTAQKVVITEPISAEERTKVLLQLHGWLTDWSTTAKMVIKRRDHLIRLGAAKRRRSAVDPTTDASKSAGTPPEPSGSPK